MFAKRRNDSCRRITHSHDGDALRPPSLFALKVLRQPLGQGGGGDTPILLPLSSSSERIGESHRTPILRNEGGPAVSQIAVMGAPLATNAISVSAPTPISMLPATIACVILLPPVKSTI